MRDRAPDQAGYSATSCGRACEQFRVQCCDARACRLTRLQTGPGIAYEPRRRAAGRGIPAGAILGKSSSVECCNPASAGLKSGCFYMVMLRSTSNLYAEWTYERKVRVRGVVLGRFASCVAQSPQAPALRVGGVREDNPVGGYVARGLSDERRDGAGSFEDIARRSLRSLCQLQLSRRLSGRRRLHPL